MGNFIFEKKIDQSVLKDGFSIPVDKVDLLQESLGVQLNKGDSIKIKIRIDNKEFEAYFNYLNFRGDNEKINRYQIRYSAGSDICQFLNSKFVSTANIVEECKKKGRKVVIEDKDQESMELYSYTDNTIEIKCNPKYDKVLADFIHYIGSEDSFYGYQCSYKLIFLKVFFERYLDEKDQEIKAFSHQFLKFYLDRFKEGKKTDVGVVDIIANPVKTSSPQVIELILRNPYKHIHEKGFFNIEHFDGGESFCMSEELKSHMTMTSAQNILVLINKKIANYYRIKVDMLEGNLYDDFNKLINEYLNVKKQAFASNPFGKFVRDDIPEDLYKIGFLDKSKYKITGSVGQGNWAMIPWIGIFDKQITSSATKGVYIVYLLSKDSDSLYLTFNQGCTEIRQSHSKIETIDIMRKNASRIVKEIDSRGFSIDEHINLGSDLTNCIKKEQFFIKSIKKAWCHLRIY